MFQGNAKGVCGTPEVRPCCVTVGPKVPPNPGAHSSTPPHTHTQPHLLPHLRQLLRCSLGPHAAQMAFNFIRPVPSGLQSKGVWGCQTVMGSVGVGRRRIWAQQVFWDSQHLVLKYLGFIPHSWYPSHPCSSARSSWGHHRSREFVCLFLFYRKGTERARVQSCKGQDVGGKKGW